MAETATAPAAPAAPTTQSAPAAAPPPSAGAQLTSVPTGEWASGFKNEALKSFVQERKFTDPEQLVERYQNLEKLRGVPEERLLKLPEKMEGDDARAVWQRLGTPKDAKGYEIPRDEKSDPTFIEWAETAFHQNNLTKAQALGVVKAYNEKFSADIQAQAQARALKIAQGEETLKREWGPRYEANLNLAKQGAKILGLDANTLDIMEAAQGRDVLFKNLQKIGVGVGESQFIDGGTGTPTTMTAEQAQEEINKLIKDQKFAKKLTRGDVEAKEKWDKLNVLASPGTKQIG